MTLFTKVAADREGERDLIEKFFVRKFFLSSAIMSLYYFPKHLKGISFEIIGLFKYFLTFSSEIGSQDQDQVVSAQTSFF